VNGTLFPHNDTMQKAEDAASDHAALGRVLAFNAAVDLMGVVPL